MTALIAALIIAFTPAYIAHDMLDNQVVILHEGKIAASGEIAEIVQGDESLEDAFVRLVRG